MPGPAIFAIEPVRATRTFEAAIEHLTEAIERAGLRTGDRLPNEGVLAEQLGISKPTLRQALRVLELSGLVEVRRGKSGGIFVVTDLVPRSPSSRRSSSRSGRRSTCFAPGACSSARSSHEAMRTATPDDFVELERTVDLLERHLGERPSVMRADAMFHRALVRACRNETIQAAMRGVGRGLAPIRDAQPGGAPTTRRRSTSTGASSPRCGAKTPSELDEVLDEHFRMLETQFAKAIGRRWSELFGRARGAALAARRDERRHGARLGLEHRVLDVAEILAVDLERQRRVAADLEPAESCSTVRPRRGLPPRERSKSSRGSRQGSRRPARRRRARGRTTRPRRAGARSRPAYV